MCVCVCESEQELKNVISACLHLASFQNSRKFGNCIFIDCIIDFEDHGVDRKGHRRKVNTNKASTFLVIYTVCYYKRQKCKYRSLAQTTGNEWLQLISLTVELKDPIVNIVLVAINCNKTQSLVIYCVICQKHTIILKSLVKMFTTNWLNSSLPIIVLEQ